jgi:hypothetical protein
LETAYTLQRILDPDFTYPTDPADGIASVRLVNVDWVPNHKKLGKHLQTGFSEDETRQQWLKELHADLQTRGYTASDVTVKKVEFELTLMTNGVTPTKKIRFSVTLPHWCSLAKLSDEEREIVMRCLRLWGMINE